MRKIQNLIIKHWSRNLYGDYDNFDSESSHLYQQLLEKSIAKKHNQNVIEIWGDGKSKRECMHVKDLVDAIVFCNA